MQALIGAGLSSQAKPLVDELVAVIQAARGPRAEVVSLAVAVVHGFVIANDSELPLGSQSPAALVWSPHADGSDASLRAVCPADDP